MDQVLTIGKATKVTKTIHGAPYDAISVTNPKNTQVGKTIFITGGGTAIGKAVGVAFARASAKTIIIVGRRADVLKQGAEHIEKEAKIVGTSTKVIHRALDITSHAAVDGLFKELAVDGITIDVFVSNAAAFTEPKPMLELGAEEVLRQMDTNVAAPIYILSKFHAQGKGAQQVRYKPASYNP
jgi:NAD(P)-dependent dehydrogenase (short-subunit alcohol dehydrogenase family)